MQLHGLGIKAPSFEQFDLLGHQAVLTALAATFPAVSPRYAREVVAMGL
jgi:hypothetical protein